MQGKLSGIRGKFYYEKCLLNERRTDTSTVTVVDFNTLISVINSTSRQKKSVKIKIKIM